MRKLFLLSLTLFFLFGLASQSWAVPTIPWNLGTLNTISDDSGEYLLKYDDVGDLDNPDSYSFNESSPATVIDVYDRFRGAFDVQTISDGLTTTNLPADEGIEFTGVFDLLVLTKERATDADGNPITVTDPGGNNVDLYDFTFGPSPVYEAQTGITGAMLTNYIDEYGDGDDFERGSVSSDPEDVIDTAWVGKDEYWTFGFSNKADPLSAGEGWITRGSEDLSIFQTFGQGSEQGEVNFSLNMLNNHLGPQLSRSVGSFIVPGINVDFTGSAGLKGVDGQTTPMQVFNNLDGELAPVPEPTTLLLFGTGLLGLAAFGRKKFMKKS